MKTSTKTWRNRKNNPKAVIIRVSRWVICNSTATTTTAATSKDYGYDCSGGTSIDWGDVGVDSLR